MPGPVPGRLRIGLLAAILLAGPSVAGADRPPTDARIGIADVAVSWVRLDRQLTRDTPEGELRTRVNSVTRAAAMAALSGRPGGVAAVLDELTRELTGLDSAPGIERVLRLAPVDAIGNGTVSDDGATAITLRERYRAPAEGTESAGEWVIQVHPDGPVRADDLAAGSAIASGRLSATAGAEASADERSTIDLDRPVPDGRWRIIARPAAAEGAAADGGGAIELGQWTVSRTSFDVFRESGLARIEALRPGISPAWTDAVRRRLGRLRDTSAGHDLDAFAIDRVALREQVTAELAALDTGRHPFAGTTGDRWLPIGRGSAAARLIVPAGLDRDALPPLLIALHGVGGNIHLMPDAQGGGRLIALAAERGFVLVSPSTTWLALPGNLEALLEVVREVRPFDPDRVVIVGHSMGGMIGGRLASAHPERIAAAALIAGGPTLRSAGGVAAPPLRYIGAEDDRIVPAAAVRRAAEASAARGVPAEYVEVPAAGHVLVIHDALEAAVDWVLEQAEPPGPRPGHAAPRTLDSAPGDWFQSDQ